MSGNGQGDGAQRSSKPSATLARKLDLALGTPYDDARRAQLVSRMDQVEVWMAEGWSTTDIQRFCEREWGVVRRTARRYIRATYRRLRAESGAIDRDKRRAQLEQMAMTAYRKASDRKRGVLVPPSDDKPGRVELVPDPDSRGMTDAAKFLSMLYGVNEPETVTHRIEVSQVIPELQRAYGAIGLVNRARQLRAGEDVIDVEGEEGET